MMPASQLSSSAILEFKAPSHNFPFTQGACDATLTRSPQVSKVWTECLLFSHLADRSSSSWMRTITITRKSVDKSGRWTLDPMSDHPFSWLGRPNSQVVETVLADRLVAKWVHLGNIWCDFVTRLNLCIWSDLLCQEANAAKWWEAQLQHAEWGSVWHTGSIVT